jgi:vancomycin aglycone glucosyltransferase
MKVLLSSIGSRGDVQPILALAVELQAHGHTSIVCAAPNFQTWMEGYGVGFFPIGPDLEKWTRSAAQAPMPVQKPTAAQRRELARYTVIGQFKALIEAAKGCDLIVVGGVLQTAGRSIAEALKIPYVYASYCPATLPSAEHPPAKMGEVFPQSLPPTENRALWTKEVRTFNQLFRDTINEQRAELGLAPISNVLRHISTDQPMLAADPMLAPAGAPMKMRIRQTGAWFLPNPTPLSAELEAFLADGEPPIYFGFGSMRAAEQTSRVMIEAARAVGRRAILLQGWGNLNVIDDGADCISIGDVDHEKLLPRVAVVVHHGGAGTTTAAARAGKSQVIVPHVYDQYYWAHRVTTLGVGVSRSSAGALMVDALVEALWACLTPEMSERAQQLASRIEPCGVQIAAKYLMEMMG